jgi:molybdenum cofactor cytidylyltransferase
MAFAPPCAVTVPIYQGQRGHPVRFGLECLSDLMNLQGNQGAAQLIRRQEATDSIAMIDLDDVGCVMDVDTLDDLQRAQAVLLSRKA